MLCGSNLVPIRIISILLESPFKRSMDLKRIDSIFSIMHWPWYFTFPIFQPTNYHFSLFCVSGIGPLCSIEHKTDQDLFGKEKNIERQAKIKEFINYPIFRSLAFFFLFLGLFGRANPAKTDTCNTGQKKP